jgi:hypothetical protein
VKQLPYQFHRDHSAALNAVELLELMEQLRPAWHDHAACKNQTALMFPAPGLRGKRVDYSRAVALCARCPVQEQCRRQGANEEHGVWGGIAKDRPRRQDPAAALLADSDDWWTSSQVAEALNISPQNAQRRLARLVDVGALMRSTNHLGHWTYRYRREI